jgi:lantibiotic modifying enzyme
MKQKTYFCPYCEEVMDKDDVQGVRCLNDACEYSEVAWHLPKLESFDINKQQRLLELVEDV